MKPQAAVLGSPIAHSLSPVIHAAAYAWLGLDWDYGRVELQPAQVAGFIDGLDESWRGLSVTMPLKEAAAACGIPDADVLLTGAANTVVLGEQRRVYNTDIAGLTDALTLAGLPPLRVATLIGNGATARSALVALVRAGVRLVEVQGRNHDRLAEFRDWAEQLDVEVQPRSLGAPLDPASELLVSTVPSAALEGRLDQLEVELCPALRGVFDVIYHPWPTPLAQRAEAAGRVVLNGLELLVHQARHQVRLMTGHDVPIEVLMSAVRAELSARAVS
ncbi:MAG: shikimate dehydrogenase [Micropruina sp.]|uniref:shikimate dehydrogenase n=1 Tax=Micropruina sp. TaxID=2737536 RepID=UPI0039E69150